jgi:hypothetical protein
MNMFGAETYREASKNIEEDFITDDGADDQFSTAKDLRGKSFLDAVSRRSINSGRSTTSRAVRTY